MKKRIVMMLLLTVMTAGVFTGCGNKIEGEVQAAMADVGNSQEDLESETDEEESSPEATVKPTEEPTSEVTAEPKEESTPEATAAPTTEPTEKPDSTTEPDEGTESETAADSSEDAATNNSANTSQQSTETNNTTQGTTANNDTSASATDTTAQGTDTTAQTQTSNYLSQGFVNYLNQKRTAAGLSEITWNSGLESLVLTRAQEIATNFAHPTVMEASEIILATPESDPSSWYDSWYDSYGHRLVMEDKYLVDGACGVYQVGNYYYVVFAGNINHGTEYIEEQMNNGSMTSSTWTASDGTEITSYYTEEGGGVIRPGHEEEDIASLEAETGIEWANPNDVNWDF